MDNKAKQFFKRDKASGSIIFVGDTLEITLNSRYGRYGYLTIDGSSVATIAIFDMLINGKIQSGMLLPAVIEIDTSDIREKSDEKFDTVVLTLQTGDTFITNTNLVRDSNVAYAVYYECIYMGARPNFLTYDRIISLFDSISSVAGVDFHIDHAMFEAYYAYLYRAKNNVAMQYRLTDRKEPPLELSMQAVAHVATTTTSKLVGAYFNDALNSALVNQSERTTELEGILSK